MSGAPLERPLGPAAIVGAVKGGLAGLLLGVPIAHLVGPASMLQSVQLVGGLIVACATLCGLDAASGRMKSPGLRLALRFLAGAVTPIVIASAQFSIGTGLGATTVDSLVLPLGTFAAALGLGFIVAGQPDTLPHHPQSMKRLLTALVFAVFPLTAFFAVFEGPAEGVSTLANGLCVSLAWGAFFQVAQRLTALAATPLARWLEPDVEIDARSSS